MILNTDILFTTTGSICGREITDYLGILIERESVPAEIDTLDMLYALDARYASLSVSMNARATDLGADAVVGVDFKTDVLGDRIVFTMTGNAVRLKPVSAAEKPEIPAPEAEEAPESIYVFEEAEPEPEETNWQCPGCGAENDLRYRYCPSCGEMRRDDWKCPGCGMENLPEYRFCPGCGAERG